MLAAQNLRIAASKFDGWLSSHPKHRNWGVLEEARGRAILALQEIDAILATAPEEPIE